MGLENTLHNRWGYNLVSCLDVGKLSSRIRKTPHLSIGVKQTCTLLSSFVRVCPSLVQQMNKATG